MSERVDHIATDADCRRPGRFEAPGRCERRDLRTPEAFIRHVEGVLQIRRLRRVSGGRGRDPVSSPDRLVVTCSNCR